MEGKRRKGNGMGKKAKRSRGLVLKDGDEKGRERGNEGREKREGQGREKQRRSLPYK